MLPCPAKWPKLFHMIRLNRYNKMRNGKKVNFHNPVTFNEKIQWYMVNCNSKQVSEFTDKVSFKDYVKRIIGEGYTARLLDVWSKPEDVDFSKLHAPFVVKSNCSGDGINIRIITNDDFDRTALKAEVTKWFDWRNTFINSSSRAYFRIKPKVLVEEYLQAPDGDLIDYKFFCFNGKPYCIYTSFGGFDYTGDAKFAFYNTQWEQINIKYGDRKIETVPRPHNLPKMLEIAAKLSEGFPFVRVDFYDLAERIIVGEMTYDSSWGQKQFEPESFDYELGAQFDLSIG